MKMKIPKRIAWLVIKKAGTTHGISGNQKRRPTRIVARGTSKTKIPEEFSTSIVIFESTRRHRLTPGHSLHSRLVYYKLTSSTHINYYYFFFCSLGKRLIKIKIMAFTYFFGGNLCHLITHSWNQIDFSLLCVLLSFFTFFFEAYSWGWQKPSSDEMRIKSY